MSSHQTNNKLKQLNGAGETSKKKGGDIKHARIPLMNSSNGATDNEETENNNTKKESFCNIFFEYMY
jgi:hypothetical protein